MQKHYISSLILGGEKEGKTTIALKTALDSALNGEYSLWIGIKDKIEKLFTPSLIPAIANSPNFTDCLRYVDICYADRRDSIIEITAAVQFYKNRPNLIIVEDLSTLVDPLHTRPRNDPEYLQQVLIIVSHLQDLAASMSSQDNQVHIIITDSCEEVEYKALLKRCMDYVVYSKLNTRMKTYQCFNNRDLDVGYDSMNELVMKCPNNAK